MPTVNVTSLADFLKTAFEIFRIFCSACSCFSKVNFLRLNSVNVNVLISYHRSINIIFEEYLN